MCCHEVDLCLMHANRGEIANVLHPVQAALRPHPPRGLDCKLQGDCFVGYRLNEQPPGSAERLQQSAEPDINMAGADRSFCAALESFTVAITWLQHLPTSLWFQTAAVLVQVVQHERLVLVHAYCHSVYNLGDDVSPPQREATVANAVLQVETPRGHEQILWVPDTLVSLVQREWRADKSVFREGMERQMWCRA